MELSKHRPWTEDHAALATALERAILAKGFINRNRTERVGNVFSLVENGVENHADMADIKLLAAITHAKAYDEYSNTRRAIASNQSAKRTHKHHRGGGRPKLGNREAILEACKTATRDAVAARFGVSLPTVYRILRESKNG